MYSVLRNKNDWISNYKGLTFTDKLQAEITKGVFQEHAKFKSGNEKFMEQLGKKSVVSCIDPISKELLSVGASSLLRNEKTGEIMDNVILNNFGLFFASLFRPTNLGSVTGVNLLDDTNTSFNFYIYNNSNTDAFNSASGAVFGGGQIKMGSGTTTPLRSDVGKNGLDFTNLGSSPESGYTDTNVGAWTAQNTVVYQGDYNPTGGSGTVNEIGSFFKWIKSPTDAFKNIMAAHDAVTPAVTYSAGKLLRGAYSWQL